MKRKLTAIIAVFLICSAQSIPWNCGAAGRGVLLSFGGLLVSTITGNPLAAIVSTLILANNMSNWAACQEANGNGAAGGTAGGKR